MIRINRKSLAGVIALLAIFMIVALSGKVSKAETCDACYAAESACSEEISDEAIENALKISNYLLPVFSSNDKVSAITEYKLLSGRIKELLAEGNAIVMLDPGHGGSDPGASVYTDGTRIYPNKNDCPNGIQVKEADLNYMIGVAARDTLSTYNNVTVLMTRTPALTGRLEVGTRCDMAAEAGAILLVSLHLNISTNHEAHGVEVWCQNDNFRPDLGAWSKQFGAIAARRLAELGLYNRGAKTKNSDKEKYEDGSAGDYYGINRGAKKHGITSVIIEHAFMDNQADYDLALSTEEKVQNLGMVDANAIAEFMGLNEPEGELGQVTAVNAFANGPTSIQVDFTYEGEIRPTGYALFRSDNPDSGFVKVATVTNSETSIVDRNAEVGVMYYYRVLPFINRITGYREGYFSNPVSAKALGTPVLTDVMKSGENGYYITYAGALSMDGYIIYRASAGDSEFREIGRTEANNYMDNTAEAGKAYAYKVQSYCTVNGEVQYSGISDAKMIGTEMEYIRYMSATEIQLGWIPMAGVDGYNVYRKAEGESNYTLLESRPSTWLPQYIDKKVEKYVKYYYMVCAYIKVGQETVISKGAYIESGDPLDAPTISKAQCYLVSGSIVIAWNKVDGAQGYQLYRVEHAGDPHEKLATISSGSTTVYTDTTAEKGHTYLYYVRAFTNEGSKTGYSSMSDYVMSSVPIRAVVQASENSMNVAWVKMDNVDGYRIYRRDGYKGDFVYIGNAGKDADIYVDENLKTNVTYCYRVVAYRTDIVGSDKYDIVSKETSHIGNKLVKAPKVKKCKANKEDGAVDIEWEEVAGATGYEIYRSNDISEEFGLLDVIGAVTSYEDKFEIDPETTYFYYIRALFNKNDVTGATGMSELAMSGVGLTGLYATSSKEIEMTWPVSAMYDGIKIYRKKHSASNYSLIATIAKSAGIFKDTGLSAGTVYDYKLVTYNKDKNGKKIDADTLTVSCETLYTPTLTGATMKAGGGVNLAWTKITASTGYEIYRSETGKSGTFDLIATVEGSDTVKYLDETASKDHLYYYTIKAIKANGKQISKSSYSSYRINTVATCTIRGLNSSSIRITWVEVEGATKYSLYRKKSGENKYTLLKTFKPGTALYVDSGLKLGETYDYRIQVTDGKYTSGYSYGYAVHLLEKVTEVNMSYNEDTHVVSLSWAPVEGADRYEIYRKPEGGSYEKLTLINGLNYYEDTTAIDVKHYYYMIRALGYQNSVTQYGSFSDAIEAEVIVVNPGEEGLTPIMGRSKATAEQMVKFFNNSGKPFPDTYATEQFGNVDTIEKFVQIIIEEAEAEGVRADVLCCQIYKETGFLQFGGDVQPDQCNFGGLGATGGGEPGCVFPDVRTGIRAQVQHLKLYACENPEFVNENVDPRFWIGIAGTAKYVEWLGIHENPYGKGWAAGVGYGYSIVEMMAKMAAL